MTGLVPASTRRTMTDVQIISAPWCKRCHTIKPEVEKHCVMTGASFTVVDYEEMEEADKSLVKSLPTIRMRVAPTLEWTTYTADTLETFKAALTQTALVSTTDTDF